MTNTDYKNYLNFVANNIKVDFVKEVDKGYFPKVTEDIIRKYINNALDDLELGGKDLIGIYAQLPNDQKEDIDFYYSDYENVFELLLHGMTSVIWYYATKKIKEHYNIED